MRIDRVKFVTILTEKDLSLKRLAEVSGLSRATLSGIKCGKTCSASTASKVAQALNTPLESLTNEREAS